MPATLESLQDQLDDLGHSIDRANERERMLVDAVERMLIGAAAVGVPHPREREVLQEAVNFAQDVLKKIKTRYGIHGGTIAPDATPDDLAAELVQQTVVGKS